MMDRFCNAVKKGTARTLWRKSAGAECFEANTTVSNSSLTVCTERIFLFWTLSPAALLPPQGCVYWCRREVTSPWQNQSVQVWPQTPRSVNADFFFFSFWLLFLHFLKIWSFPLLKEIFLNRCSMMPMWDKCTWSKILKGTVHPKN